MNEIISAFREHNLDPGQIVCDGKIHRFKVDSKDTKKSGWYLAFQNYTRKSGELFYVVMFGNYQDSDSPWKYQSDNVKFTAEDRVEIKKQIARAKAVADREIAAGHELVASEIEKKWEQLSNNGTSQYLVRKQIDKVSGLNVKFDQEGNFYVDARDIDGKMWTWERVGWDGNKRFHQGGRVQGCFHIIGKLPGRVFRFAEGFSTAASVAAATGEGVVCCFSATNMSHVVTTFRKRYPEGEFFICGDDDKWKDKNTGREIADGVAKANFASVIFPKFKNEDSKPKDWNDLHVLEGLAAVKEQITGVKPAPKMALYALGFSEGTYFFTSTANRQVVPIQSFGEDQLLKLMPLSYWEAVFPGATERSRVDWTMAKSELMGQCRSKGIFDGGRVRGAGVWMDDGRIVVNMGDHLMVDGVRFELGVLPSRYFYTLGKRLERLRENPLTVDECKILIDSCTGFKWAKPREAGLILAGVLVLSRVCGALPVRPHCWITGGAQTGKTTLLENLVQKILGENKLYVQGNTTEAGVRQSLKADAVPVLFDEFETNGPRSAENIAACVELMRASWASSGAMIIKGGATGTAMHFQVRFSAIVSSIRTGLKTDADKGRFTILELAPHGSDAEHWKGLSALLAQIDEEYSERLFARVIKMLPILILNFKKMKVALARKADSRFGDQYGMILAGFSILTQDGPITEADADWMAELVGLEEEREVATQADHDDALAHLLTTKITIDTASGRQDVLIGFAIETVFKNIPSTNVEACKNALLNLGIKVNSDFVLIPSSNHAELEAKVWRPTQWAGNWGRSLARIPGSEKKRNLRFSGSMKDYIAIPTATFQI